MITNILKEKKSYIIEDDNIIYQITSTSVQNKNESNNISTIILGECENILKKKYDINDGLIIFKIDYFKEGASIPIIGYELYHPISKIKLNLSYCNEENIKFNYSIPVSIDEDNILKYDPKNEYYSDLCIPTTSENGTDILLNDRQNEFNDNNMLLCEKTCIYIGYINKTAKCECDIKNEQIIISEIENQKDILEYTFINDNNDMITMKCYNTLFTKEGLIGNIGSYLLLSIILIIIISGILFYKFGYYFLEEIINEIINDKEENNKINNNDNNRNETIDIKSKNKGKLNNKGKDQIISKGKSKIKKKKLKNYNKSISNNLKNKNKKSINSKTLSINNNSKSFSKLDPRDLLTSIEKNKVYNEYNDYELNSLSYINAIKYDKRKFLSYYLLLIRTKNILVFAFFPLKDYNSRIIKIDLFFISFSFNYFINALFFNESIIHQIYEDGGFYNFIFLIPYISYSFAITLILNIIIKYIFLSERNICEIKNENTLEKSYDKIGKVKKCIVIKYICFFTLFSLINIFFWYYLSSFGAVFQNTQIYLVKNTLISFGFSLIFPLVFNLLPAIFRIYSLDESNRKCFYKFSKIIQII